MAGGPNHDCTLDRLGGASLEAGRPHLNQVELGEEAHALGHGRGRGAALLGHVVDGHLHVVDQLALQEEQEEAAEAAAQASPGTPGPLAPWPQLSGQRSCLEPGATCSAWAAPHSHRASFSPPRPPAGLRGPLAGDVCVRTWGRGWAGARRHPALFTPGGACVLDLRPPGWRSAAALLPTFKRPGGAVPPVASHPLSTLLGRRSAAYSPQRSCLPN